MITQTFFSQLQEAQPLVVQIFGNAPWQSEAAVHASPFGAPLGAAVATVVGAGVGALVGAIVGASLGGAAADGGGATKTLSVPSVGTTGGGSDEQPSVLEIIDSPAPSTTVAIWFFTGTVIRRSVCECPVFATGA